MNKSVMAAVFGAGLVAVGWVGWGFVGTSPLALAMTALIGSVYLLGAWELARHRAATAALAAALDGPAEPLDGQSALDAWLARLPAPLRHPVRQRIEGERAALPGPALTPYLVGLLVMLGMLGTFVGMVVTFSGAVFALEGSASLESIRAALSAPIKGLGLAFGTSVAGVAASAMLGLLSTLARRERLGVLRLLDARIPTLFRRFSPAQRREELFAALQSQAQALPLIAERLDALATGLERRQEALSSELAARQQDFHREAAAAYMQLADTVGGSLRASLDASARQATETLRPVVEQAMAALAAEARQSHERLREASGAQMAALSAQWEGTARQVAATWTDALARQGQAQDSLVAQLGGALDATTSAFDQRTGALLAGLEQSAAQARAAQEAADRERLAGFGQALQELSGTLAAQWQQLGAQAAAQQQAACQALEATADRAAERLDAQAAQSLAGATRWLEQSDALLRARTEAEAGWVQAQGERLDALAGVWRTELAALRDAEAARGQAAVERLDALQAAAAQHLAGLGAALEAPLTRLLHTASEVPQAAAQVIAQLREEMARLGERDNLALAERTALVEQLGGLLGALDAAAGRQQAAIESLVGSATTVLEQAGQQFSQSLGAQAGRIDEVAAHVAASAVELASLGEAFQQGVGLFSASNEKLVAGLQGVEGAVAQSLARSDEQLAYYVAQAREVIDLSISAQQGIVQDLQRLQARPAAPAALAEGAAA